MHEKNVFSKNLEKDKGLDDLIKNRMDDEQKKKVLTEMERRKLQRDVNLIPCLKNNFI